MGRIEAAKVHRPLALAMVLAILAPGQAFAQAGKEQEQDERILQLEAQVQALKEMLQMQQAPVAAAVPATTASATAAKPIQATTISPAAAAGTRFSYGGFIKLDAMSTWTSEGAIPDASPGRMFYFPAGTPVDAGDGASYNDVHAQFSRVWFSADRVSDEGDRFKGYVEFDFFGGGNTNVGNEKFSNGYPPTLRHAYASWNNWLAGQTWTNFMDLGSLPESVDFVGVVDGTVFVRQGQLRYSTGAWSFSLENPQTWYQAGSPAHVSSGANNLPDLTARWQRKGDWGHFSVAGLVRQLKTATDDTTGLGLSVAGSFKLGQADVLQYMASGGPGIGRYLAFGLGPDAYLDSDGHLEAQDMSAGFVAWRHHYNARLRSTLAYSAAYMSTDEAAVGPNATERTQSWRANLIYSPFQNLDVGAEISWGQRQLSGEGKGDLKRFHTTVKYAF